MARLCSGVVVQLMSHLAPTGSCNYHTDDQIMAVFSNSFGPVARDRQKVRPYHLPTFASPFKFLSVDYRKVASCVPGYARMLFEINS